MPPTRDELRRVVPPAVMERITAELDGPGGAAPKRSKYGNVRTPALGQIWDSAKEARYAVMLDLGHRAGLVKWWCFKPRFILEGTTYEPDFIVLWADARGLQIVDVKGGQATKTKAYRQKRRAMLERYGIEIVEV
jgi:hypothetical protein